MPLPTYPTGDYDLKVENLLAASVAASVKFLREHGGPFVYSETRAYSWR